MYTVKALTPVALSGILLVILFQCCPCTSVAPPNTPTPTYEAIPPFPTHIPTLVPTLTPVTIAPMQLGQYGTHFDGLSISVLWLEWTDFYLWEFGRIDADPAHHILWIHVQVENRSASPVLRPNPLLFDLWHQGRQVGGIFENSPESDAHQPPLECGPYRMMSPGEFCEGWLYFFPDVPDDWSREDLMVSYGMSCESEYRVAPLPCLYWRLE